ncbi:MAG: hypothetical protein ACI9G1_005595 [Pirellulaceae bacterium]|jgi:hypothetical protein
MNAANPYASPRQDGFPWLIKSARYFPLDIKERRLIAFDIPADQLPAKISEWAGLHRFKVEREGEQWKLTRGTLFDALFSFTVEHLPTTVTLKRIGPTASELQIDLHCSSLFSVARPGDPNRLTHELHSLEDQLLIY